MNPRVKSVRPLQNYRLSLTFDNGETATYDCRHLLDFGVFSELKDEEYFRQVAVQWGTVVWPHEQDICPDTLYADSLRTSRAKARRPKLKGKAKASAHS